MQSQSECLSKIAIGLILPIILADSRLGIDKYF